MILVVWRFRGPVYLVCAGCEQIFEDKLSGIRTGRPGLKRALKRLQKGDALVVWKLD
ncbi:recombinase family protein [Escherichia coli]|nr:recombinase family protein [Escherichia coli]